MNQFEIEIRSGADHAMCMAGAHFLCHSKNKPPAMQGEGISLDKSMSSCARIKWVCKPQIK